MRRIKLEHRFIMLLGEQQRLEETTSFQPLVIALASGANIIASPTNLAGRVTVNLTDVHWQPALESILAERFSR